MSSISSDSISICANCGKGGEGNNDIKLKTCTACRMVKYCSRECQIAHRPQHKRECKKRATELHDEKLFNQPPQFWMTIARYVSYVCHHCGLDINI